MPQNMEKYYRDYSHFTLVIQTSFFLGVIFRLSFIWSGIWAHSGVGIKRYIKALNLSFFNKTDE